MSQSEENNLLKNIVRNLLIALKNSIFYNTNHPLCRLSIENLKKVLDHWFQTRDRFEFGISTENLFLNNEPIKIKDSSIVEIAHYLHNRGIISLSFTDDITVKDLTDFIDMIRMDGKTIKQKGGLIKHIPPGSGIQIKEIDYSHLLNQTFDEGTSGDRQLWQALFQIHKLTNNSPLPESRIDLMVQFIKDSKRSAALLNKVYKQALQKKTTSKTVHAVQAAIIQICRHFQNQDRIHEAKEFKTNLMHVISQLHPDLIVRLFEQSSIQGETFNLAIEITRDFSDTYIAGFIESLISQQGSINENLLRLFDKLAPDSTRLQQIVPLVADNLFAKRMIHPRQLTQVQLSIQEIFKKQSKNDFIQELYQITVDAVIHQKFESLIYIARLSPLIQEFTRSMEVEELIREKCFLLLNLMWHETDKETFSELGDNLQDTFSDLLHKRDIQSLSEIVLFIKNEVPPYQQEHSGILAERDKIYNHIINRETLTLICNMIPDLELESFDALGKILTLNSKLSVPLLIKAFVENRHPIQRSKISALFSPMQKAIEQEVTKQLREGPAYQVKDLFALLKQINPDALQQMAREMMNKKQTLLLWEGLAWIRPETKEDFQHLFHLVKRGKTQEIREKALSLLANDRDPKILYKLFRAACKGKRKKELLIPFMDTCGQLQIDLAYPYIKKIFNRKPLLQSTTLYDKFRISAASNMFKINKSDTLQMLKEHRDNGSAHFKAWCRKCLIHQLTSGERHEIDTNN